MLYNLFQKSFKFETIYKKVDSIQPFLLLNTYDDFCYLVAENHVICKLKPNEAIPSFLGASYTLDPTGCKKIFGMLEHIFYLHQA